MRYYVTMVLWRVSKCALMPDQAVSVHRLAARVIRAGLAQQERLGPAGRTAATVATP